MLTRLQKALGLKRARLSDDAARLQRLALQGRCAGDDYYFSMSDLDFAACMRGDEDEDVYLYYARQRAIGMPAFQQEVADELARCSGGELDVIARAQSFNAHRWCLRCIVAQPACELATARYIYWASQPESLYRCHGSIAGALAAGDVLVHDRARLLLAIEERARSTGFPQQLALQDLSGFRDPEHAGTRRYGDGMPEILRL